MRIHIIGINYWPEATGIAVFTTGRAEYLAACGHEVNMCAAVPYYPEWRVANEYRRRSFAVERRGGVRIFRCPLYVPAIATTFRRILHEGSFALAALARSLSMPRPDVLLIVSPPLGLSLVAFLLSCWWRAPYVFHVADLQPDTALDLGMMKAGTVARFLYALERFAYRHAAKVSTLTDAMRAKILAKDIPPKNVLLFSDWADPRLFDLEPGRPDPEIRHELRLDNDFIVLHAGNMGVKQGLHVVLEAARRTKDPTMRYVFVGDGVMRHELEARARAMNLANVRFLPLLDRGRFERLLAVADLCLVTQQRTVADVVFPSKVLTLLAAAKPVVASVAAASEVARVVKAAEAGEVVAPEDPDRLARAIAKLRGSKARRSQMAESGRNYARRHWDRDRTLQHLAARLERIMESHPHRMPAREAVRRS
ncbi:MAG TPA: WcaI family glycosyltransferase [Vicinamibacterales bacterium]